MRANLFSARPAATLFLALSTQLLAVPPITLPAPTQEILIESVP